MKGADCPLRCSPPTSRERPLFLRLLHHLVATPRHILSLLVSKHRGDDCTTPPSPWGLFIVSFCRKNRERGSGSCPGMRCESISVGFLSSFPFLEKCICRHLTDRLLSKITVPFCLNIPDSPAWRPFLVARWPYPMTR